MREIKSCKVRGEGDWKWRYSEENCLFVFGNCCLYMLLMLEEIKSIGEIRVFPTLYRTLKLAAIHGTDTVNLTRSTHRFALQGVNHPHPYPYHAWIRPRPTKG